MSEIKRPIVHDAATNQHREAVPGIDVINGRTVQISDDAQNALRVGTDGGLMVKAADTEASALISSQTPNAITPGSDDKLRVVPANLVSGDTPNSLGVGSDGKLKVTTVQSSSLISSDANNAINTGGDGKLYARKPVAGDFVSTDAGNKLSTGLVDGRIFYGGEQPANLISTNANNAIVTGSDNRLFVPRATAPGLISNDVGNVIRSGSDGQLYASASEIITIDGSDKILTKTTYGLKGEVAMSFNSSTQTVSLTGKGGVLISSFVLPDASIGLVSATVVTNPGGQPAGTYLVLVFDVAGGGTDTVYVNLSALVQVYTAADSTIDITNYAIRVKLDPNAPFAVTASGMRFNYTAAISSDAGNEITTGADGKFKFVSKATSDQISSNAGNILRLGTDSKFFVPEVAFKADMLAAGGGMALDAQGKLRVNTQELLGANPGTVQNILTTLNGGFVAVPATCISSTVGNQITTGTDGGLVVYTALAATASQNGTRGGTVVLAADTNTTARDLAATPAGVAAQITTAAGSGGPLTPATRVVGTSGALHGGGALSSDLALTVDEASASAATTVGGTKGVVILAAGNDKTSYDKAATPAGTDAQIVAGDSAVLANVDSRRYLNKTEIQNLINSGDINVSGTTLVPILWDKTLVDPVGQSFKSMSQGIVPVICSDGKIHMVPTRDGSKVWEYCALQTFRNMDSLNGIYTHCLPTPPEWVGRDLRTDVKEIWGSHYNVFVLFHTGEVWGCGLNNYGQLGIGHAANNSGGLHRYGRWYQPILPGPVDTLFIGWSQGTTTTAMPAFALLEDGRLYAWGNSYYGCLGLGNVNTVNATPMQVPGLPTDTRIKKIVMNPSGNYSWHTHLLMENGEVWNTGYNGYGQLGDSTKVDQKVFGKRATNSPVKDIWAQDYNTLVLCADDRLRYSGSEHDRIPASTVFIELVNAVDVQRVLHAGMVSRVGYNAAARYGAGLFFEKKDGTIWAAGYNGYGNLGVGDTTTPTNGGARQVTNTWGSGRHPIMVSGGAGGTSGTFMQMNDGSLWFAGAEAYHTQPTSNAADGNVATFKMCSVPWNGSSRIKRFLRGDAGAQAQFVELENGEVWGRGYYQDAQWLSKPAPQLYTTTASFSYDYVYSDRAWQRCYF